MTMITILQQIARYVQCSLRPSYLDPLLAPCAAICRFESRRCVTVLCPGTPFTYLQDNTYDPPYDPPTKPDYSYDDVVSESRCAIFRYAGSSVWSQSL